MKHKTVKTIFRYFFLLLAAVLVGINVQALVGSAVAGNAVPMPFGIGVSVVMSGSMEPELNVGDMIIIRAYEDGTEPEKGDVIVYQTGETAVVHRVVDVDGDTVTTQGDANNVADDPFDISAVKGKVVFSIAYIGFAISVLKTPLGITAVMALAVFSIEHSFRKEKDRKEKDVDELKAEIRTLLEEQKKEQEGSGSIEK